MSEHNAQVSWNRNNEEEFVDNKYSRGHQWNFDGGLKIPASSSPLVVPLPYSIEANIDPEEAFIASLSSCHMLFFLSIAAKRNYIVDEYIDNVIGLTDRNNKGMYYISQVTLRPSIKFVGANQPSFEQIEKMHHLSHKQCFIANSVKTDIKIDIIN